MTDAEDMALIQAEMQRVKPRSLSIYSIAELVEELASREGVVKYPRYVSSKVSKCRQTEGRILLEVIL